MIKELLLNKDVKLIYGDNLVNSCTYVSLCFVGGYSSEKILEISHLAEHIVIGFNYIVNKKVLPNRYMLNMRADARTKDDRVEFTFCVTSEAELKEKVKVLINCFNNIVITEEDLEKEKTTLINELLQENVADADIQKVKRSLKKVKVQDVLDYINTNFTADNLIIFVIGNLKEKQLTRNFNNFVDNLKLTGLKNIFNPKINDDLQGENVLNKEKREAIKLVAEIKPLVCPSTEKEKILFDLIVSYLNNFCLGIKRVLRHEKQLVYRTSVVKTNDRDKINIVALCKSKDKLKVKQEIENYLKELFVKGVSKQEFEIVKATKLDFLLARPIHLTSKLIRDIGNKYLIDKDVNADEILQLKFIEIEQENIKNFNSKEIKKLMGLIKKLNYKLFNKYLQTFKGCELTFIKEG